MKMPYRMIALDLDGTLLNSRKQIPPEAVQAIRTVCAAGKTVVFDTGRAVCELEEQIALLPEVRYAVFASGAGLYDIQEKKTFSLCGIPSALTERIFALTRTKDCMPQIVTPDADVIQASHMENLEHFHMDVYRPMYEKAMTLVPDIYAFAASCTDPFLKLNLYHADPQERIRTRAQLETPELELVYYPWSVPPPASARVPVWNACVPSSASRWRTASPSGTRTTISRCSAPPVLA